MRSLWAALIATAGMSLSLACGSPPEPPAGGGEAEPHADIPLVAGLTIVTAVHEPDRGDYESLKRVVSVDDRGYAIAYNADVPPASGGLAGVIGGLAGVRAGDRREPRKTEQVGALPAS